MEPTPTEPIAETSQREPRVAIRLPYGGVSFSGRCSHRQPSVLTSEGAIDSESTTNDVPFLAGTWAPSWNAPVVRGLAVRPYSGSSSELAALVIHQMAIRWASPYDCLAVCFAADGCACYAPGDTAMLWAADPAARIAAWYEQEIHHAVHIVWDAQPSFSGTRAYSPWLSAEPMTEWTVGYAQLQVTSAGVVDFEFVPAPREFQPFGLVKEQPEYLLPICQPKPALKGCEPRAWGDLRRYFPNWITSELTVDLAPAEMGRLEHRRNLWEWLGTCEKCQRDCLPTRKLCPGCLSEPPPYTSPEWGEQPPPYQRRKHAPEYKVCDDCSKQYRRGTEFSRDRMDAERIGEIASEDYTTVPMRLGETLVDFNERVRVIREVNARHAQELEATGTPEDSDMENDGAFEDETTEEEAEMTGDEEEIGCAAARGFFLTLLDGHFAGWLELCYVHDIELDVPNDRWVMQRCRGEDEDAFNARVQVVSQFQGARGERPLMRFDHDEESQVHYTMRWRAVRQDHGIVSVGSMDHPFRNRWKMARPPNELAQVFVRRMYWVRRYMRTHRLDRDVIQFQQDPPSDIGVGFVPASTPVGSWEGLCQRYNIYASNWGNPIVPRTMQTRTHMAFMEHALHFHVHARNLATRCEIHYAHHADVGGEWRQNPAPTWAQVAPPAAGDVAGPDFPSPRQMQTRAARRTRARRNACDLQ